MKKIILCALASAIVMASCKQVEKKIEDNGFAGVDTLVKKENFQKEVDSKKTDLFILKNDSGMVVKITNFGARIVSVLVKGKDGKYADVALGFSNIDKYLADKTFCGAIAGRYANRIAKAKFKIDGKEYKLAANNGSNSLHGGIKGFDKVVWDASQKGDTLTLKYVSADMEEGFPGKVDVELNYILTNANELKLEFSATTDKKTIINLAGHGYFNLKGEGSGDILDQFLEIFGDKTTPVDTTLIPTGKFADVKGTPFDFTTPYSIGKRINEPNDQLKCGKGYDHNWVLANQSGQLALAARVTDTISGRVMEISSTEPGIQFYSGNFMDGTSIGKAGKAYNLRFGLALEPQHYPNSPNQPNFPSVILEPKKAYKTTTVYKFLVKK
jgi:aldose 1-epimerase